MRFPNVREYEQRPISRADPASSQIIPAIMPNILPSAPVNIPLSISRIFENREESAAPPLPAAEESRRFVAQGDSFVRDARADFVQFLGHDPT